MMVFDVRTAILETREGQASIHTMIERLDEMLTQHGVDHSFALPSDDELKENQRLAYWLLYHAEQSVEVTLVVALFVRLCLGTDKQTLLETIVKSFGKCN
jgi:hypothetical protein